MRTDSRTAVRTFIRTALRTGSAAVPTDPYFSDVTLLLPGNGANGAQNNTFLDSSTNAFTITRNGNTTQGTFSPFSQTGWGNYFDGSGDYLTVPDNASLNFGSSDFTVEMWVYPTAVGQASLTLLYAKPNGSGYSGLAIGQAVGGYGALVYASSTGTSWDLASGVSAGTMTANAWNHIAVSRSGSNLRAFLNGVLGSTTNISTATLVTTTAAVSIGSSLGTASTYLTGFASNVRVVKGTAVYTAAFTPPAAPLTAITNTSLLTCQSNRFIDNSTNNFAITRNGDVSVQAFSPFNPTAAWSAATNGGSGYFDGSGDYLTVAATSSLAFGSGDYTIEGWFYVTGTSDYFVFDMRTASGIYAYVEGSTGNNFVVATSGIAQSNAGTYRVNAWNHFAFVRSGSGSNNTSIYLNGTRTLQGTDTTNYSSNTGVYVGARYTAIVPFVGYISDFRCVKGTAVYSGASLTVPTAPLTAITNTSLLLNFTNAGIYDATAKNDLETLGNAQISTGAAKWGTTSMYFDGTGDYLTSPANNLYRLMAGDFTVEMWVHLAASQANMGLVSSYTTNTGWIVRLDTTTVVFAYGTGGSATVVSNAASLTTGTWYHIAWTKSGTTLRSFVDGTQVGSNHTVSSAADTGAIGLQVGRTQTVTNDLTGYIQDLRITKGVARYTANFTPPTAAFPVQ